jgi:hypothetical protein
MSINEILLQQSQNKVSTPVLPQLEAPFSALRPEYLDLVNRISGDASRAVRYCAAKILNCFQRWKDWKVKEHRTPWTYLSLKKIHKELCSEHGIHTIRKAIAFLMKGGLVARRNNPGNGQDRTYQYQLLLEGSQNPPKRKSAAETPMPSPFDPNEPGSDPNELWSVTGDTHNRSESIDIRSTDTQESEKQKEEVQEVVTSVVVDNTLLESDEDLWEEKTSQLTPDEGQFSAAPRDTKKVKLSHKAVIKELLSNRIFIFWWAKRVEKTKFGTEELIMTPDAFVKASIRKRPEQALDMFESFQDEMGRRVENFQIRKAHDCVITAGEEEQIQAIAPYAAPAISAPLLPTEAPESAENPEAYKLYQPKQVEVAPPPAGISEMLKRTAAHMSMSKAPKVEVLSELDELNRWIADPLLRPEAVQRVMTSDLYTIDYDEEGVAYQVRRV